jgi:hypothetical protein
MGTQEGPAQEGETQGRVRLRPNRGFPLGLAQQRRPHKFSARLFDLFTAPEQGVEFSRRVCFTTAMAAAHIVVDSKEWLRG